MICINKLSRKYIIIKALTKKQMLDNLFFTNCLQFVAKHWLCQLAQSWNDSQFRPHCHRSEYHNYNVCIDCISMPTSRSSGHRPRSSVVCGLTVDLRGETDVLCPATVVGWVTVVTRCETHPRALRPAGVVGAVSGVSGFPDESVSLWSSSEHPNKYNKRSITLLTTPFTTICPFERYVVMVLLYNKGLIAELRGRKTIERIEYKVVASIISAACKIQIACRGSQQIRSVVIIAVIFPFRPWLRDEGELIFPDWFTAFVDAAAVM